MRKLTACSWVAFLSVAMAAQRTPPASQAPISPVAKPEESGTQRSVVRRVAMIDIPGTPGFPAVALAEGKLVMAHSAGNSVDVFDISKRRIVTQVPDMRGVSSVAIDEAAGRAYAANTAASEIAVLNTRDWKPVRKIALKVPPRSLLLLPKLRRLYSANWHYQSISVVDLAKGEARTVEIEGSPEALAFDSRGGHLYATLQDRRQVAVLTPDLQEQKRFSIQGSQPTGILFDDVRRRLYVAVRYAIVSMDPETGKEIGRSAAPAGVHSLQMRGDRLYAAASGGAILIYRITGQGLWAEHEVSSEVKGYALAFDPQRSLLLLPGGMDGRSKLLLLQHVSEAEPPPLASR